MNKLIIFAGIILGSFLIYQIHEGDISTSDVMVIMADSSNEESVEKIGNHVYGAVVPSELGAPQELAKFFENLKKTQTVNRFVVIGKNYSLVENGEALSSKGDNLVPFIKKSFPSAEIVQIGVKDFADDVILEDLTSKLAFLADENTVVLASTVFSKNMTALTTEFHDELSRNVLKTLDDGGLEQMDVDSPAVLSVLFKYLRLKGAEAAEIEDYSVSSGTSSFVATYSEGEVTADRELSIMAFGDMMLGRYVRTLMNQNGMDYIFENIAGYDYRFFEGADIIFGNLEGPIKGKGQSGGTSMVFDFNEDIAPFLKNYGFNLLSIANNHATDQGWDGRETTIKALDESGIGWCGHPSEADDNSVYYNKVGNKKFAFLCFHDVTYDLNDQAAVDLIKSVRAKVDYLVVSIHWGYEYKHKPDWKKQIEPGHAFVDAGADLVIGHHPHVVQSFEIYNGKPIFYSLGNFVFDQYWSTMTQEELAIGVVLDDADEYEDFSAKIYLFPMESERSQSRLMTEAERSTWIEEFTGYGDYSEDLKAQIRRGILEIGT